MSDGDGMVTLHHEIHWTGQIKQLAFHLKYSNGRNLEHSDVRNYEIDFPLRIVAWQPVSRWADRRGVVKDADCELRC